MVELGRGGPCSMRLDWANYHTGWNASSVWDVSSIFFFLSKFFFFFGYEQTDNSIVPRTSRINQLSLATHVEVAKIEVLPASGEYLNHCYPNV